MLFGHRTKSNSQKINANRTKSNVRLSSMRFDLGAVDIFTSSRLTSTERLGGEGVEESQDLDVKVGSLGQNQNNALRKHILLMLITEHEKKNVPQ